MKQCFGASNTSHLQIHETFWAVHKILKPYISSGHRSVNVLPDPSYMRGVIVLANCKFVQAGLSRRC